jgi:hypothetical protein
MCSDGTLRPSEGETVTRASIDEKSQIQPRDRTQPGLPLKPGKCGTMTHDYECTRTTALFAALERAALAGKSHPRPIAPNLEFRRDGAWRKIRS